MFFYAIKISFFIDKSHKKAGRPAKRPAFRKLVGKGLVPVFGRDAEFLPAVTTASREYATAVRSAHALTEAVLVDSLAVGGLVCTFHI